jgi:hypothetical protein
MSEEQINAVKVETIDRIINLKRRSAAIELALNSTARTARNIADCLESRPRRHPGATVLGQLRSGPEIGDLLKELMEVERDLGDDRKLLRLMGVDLE